jgi:hypothetical protein
VLAQIVEPFISPNRLMEVIIGSIFLEQNATVIFAGLSQTIVISPMRTSIIGEYAMLRNSGAEKYLGSSGAEELF